MSDRRNPDQLSDDYGLGTAMRALPLSSPPAGGWARLQRDLLQQGRVANNKPARPRRQAWAAALAAGVLLAVAWLPTRTPGPEQVAIELQSAPSPPRTSSTHPQLANLRAESQRMETWLHQLSANDAPLGGQDLMAAAELEDLIGMVDLQLSAAATDEDASASLWQHRVALLHDLATIRANSYSLAVSDIRSDTPEHRDMIN